MEAATLQEGASAPLPQRQRAHSRRYGRNTNGRPPREKRRYEGELPSDQRWIVGLVGRYAISEAGEVISYISTPPRRLTVTLHRGHPHVRIFDGIAPVWVRISLEMARSFFGSELYVFKDGDSSNVHLDNIAPVDAVKPDTERWLNSYEGLYTIDAESTVHSYKRNQRKLL